MYYVFVAVTLALVEEDGSRGNAEFIPNPDGIQASAAKAIFTFAFRPSTFMGGKLIGAYSTGEFTMEQHQVLNSDLISKKGLGIRKLHVICRIGNLT
jgi:hypothetical protein